MKVISYIVVPLFILCSCNDTNEKSSKSPEKINLDIKKTVEVKPTIYTESCG